ncbi:glycerophosphodiester phosphodiesterase [Mesobacillus maritimus]|uniref:Glycerophosphodiester phosphodiesterase n=1 Tax=Mesobacillus maritimus TaxID=1643336 RepID=A0ABS7KBD1_9BACI|nr:glycerophosphodiester phosphodiesterase [Mesobacillus maritimus]
MQVVGILVLGICLFVVEGEVAFAKDIVNIPHRGASGHAPEHTLVSYQMGENMHGDYIEVDLQMTKDGQLIAMHDDSVDRTTNGTGLVNEMTLAEMKKLDAGSWFNEQYPQFANPEYRGVKVPTLWEVFQTFGKNKRYYIETKSPEVYPGMEITLLRLVNEYKIDKDTLIVESFSPKSLKKMKKLDPSIPLVQLLSYKSNAMITDEEIANIREYAKGIGLNHQYLTQEYVQKVVGNGLELYPYTVNEKGRMQQLINWGVTGMFTNFPDMLHSVKK